MSCGTTSCSVPRLMPFGQGPPLNPGCRSTTSSNCCMGVCNPAPINVLANYPITNNQFPRNEQRVCGQAEAQCGNMEAQCAQPNNTINLNLMMRPMQGGDRPSNEPGSQEKPPTDECELEALPRFNDASCGFCMEPMRKARCVPINYVEKVCPIVPEQYYTPSPYKLDSRTTYQTYFIPKCCERVASFKPPNRLSGMEGSIEGPSEYKQAYVPHLVARYQKPSWAKKEEFQPAEGVVNGISTYRVAFQPLYSAPAKILRPRSHFEPNRVPFDDRTTYHTQFTNHCMETVKSSKPALVCDMTSNRPFHGNSIYKSTYIPHCFATKAKTYKPRFSYRKLDYGFEDDTTYSGSYRPFVFQHCTPVNKQSCYGFKDLQL